MLAAVRALPSTLLIGLLALPGTDPEKTSFSVLASFDYTEGMTLPKEVTNLDEKVVVLSGFMRREVPGSNPVSTFLLVSDGCGCSGMPKLNELAFCTLPDGVTMDIKPGIVNVTGKLYVGEEKEDGVVVMLYQIDADDVK